jgi:hypothetical protein
MERSDQISDDQGMRLGPPCHGEHFARDVLVALVALALQRKVGFAAD